MPIGRAERIGVERFIVAGVAIAGVTIPVAMSVTAIAVPPHPGAALLLGVAGAVILFTIVLTALAATRAHKPNPLTRLAARLPASLDGSMGRRRLRAALWAGATLLAFVQLVRLSAFMADPQLYFGAPFPPNKAASSHICMATYVHAADLARRSDPNVYDAAHYPAFQATGAFGDYQRQSSPVENLGPSLSDAFEYPPPFLLLPRFGLLFSNDFLTLRTAWFGLQVAGFFVFAVGLAGAIGGRRGMLAGLLLPMLWLGLPLLFNFQFGQFHLACVALAMAGMLAFQRDRQRLGGALLGAAIVTKVFPGLLVIALAAQRRWRAVAWTGVFCLGYAALGIAVLGWAPYRMFIEYQVPRILSGQAFSFFLRDDLMVASNSAVYAIPFKLQRLGVPGMSAELAHALNSAFTLVILAAAFLVGRRVVPRAQQPAAWLGLLVLGSLRSPLAPNVYAVVPALWLLTLLAAELRGARDVAVFVGAWVALGGLPPLPNPKSTIALWMVGQATMLALGFWVVFRRARRGGAEESAGGPHGVDLGPAVAVGE